MRENISQKLLIIYSITILLFFNKIQKNFILGKELEKYKEKSSDNKLDLYNQDEVDRMSVTEQEPHLVSSIDSKFKFTDAPNIGEDPSKNSDSSSDNKNTKSSDSSSSSDETSTDSDSSSEDDNSSSSEDDSSSGSSSSSENDTDSNNETSSDSSLDEEPSTSKQVGKKRKKSYAKKSVRGIKKLKREKELSETEKSKLRKFILKHHLTLLIAEIEIRLFNSKNLVTTDYWLEKNQLKLEKEFVFDIVNAIERQETHFRGFKSLNLGYYFEKINRIKRNLVPSCIGNEKSVFNQMNIFKQNTKKIKCSEIKLSFVIINLIFKHNLFFNYNMFLLYLLLCSYTELEDMEFHESLIMVLKNQHYLGAKISVIGGESFSEFLNYTKNFFDEYSNFKIQGMEKYQQLRFPLNFKLINVEEFGLNLCLVLLELHILSKNELSDRQVFLFFGSRFKSSPLVLLANDIYKLAKQNTYITTDVVASILFDNNTFIRIQKRILELHNLDLKNLKNQFNYCFEIKEGFNELLGIRRNTDIQEKSIIKTINRHKVKLNLKYPFLN
ncbi:uncharacterized protein cubi_01693 [Cryptosporidium ubiquitum]|uniref:Uncharacterized protein n=1 Tax=Cryptosporidium ubiquitum TaxID=857276 RepID=A0A1J4MFG4_9CRYT|nr:uncharacterized protein cubi_01693 [Cryptosporidium ubiquitum]OII72743.1 hypothetical protein cubi_01693 [Cryptosporidium ubiquitum]